MSDIAIATLIVTDFIDDEKLQYRLNQKNYKKVLIIYKKINKILKKLNHYIFFIIDKQNLLFLNDQKTIYRKILILKIRLIFTNRIKELKINKRYKNLLKILKTQKLNQ